MTRIGDEGEQDLVRGIQRGDRVAMKLLYCVSSQKLAID